MKKFVVIIFAFFYLFVSSGFTIHMHFCMGKMADWGLVQNRSGTCPKCGMKKEVTKDNHCCKDEHKFVKNSTDQNISETGLWLFELLSMAIQAPFIHMSGYAHSTVNDGIPMCHAPPRTDSIGIYIRNSVFRI